MIAIVTQSYDRVMIKKIQLMYSYKCDLNLEVQIFLSFLSSLCPRLLPVAKFNSLIVVMESAATANADDAADGEQLSSLSGEAQSIVRKIVRNSKQNKEKSKEIIDNLIEEQKEVNGKVEEMY